MGSTPPAELYFSPVPTTVPSRLSELWWEITEFQNWVEPEKFFRICADSSPFYK